jgi:hypothetical protein
LYQALWAAESGNEGEWLQIDLGEMSRVHAIQVNYSDHACRHYGREGGPLYHRYIIEGSPADGVFSLSGLRVFGLQNKPEPIVKNV